jgi:hypothetical protein
MTNTEYVRRHRAKIKRLRRINNCEWYLPENIVAVCREALGGTIDTDPASSDIANEVIRSKTYYTKETNGLAHPWYGTVLLNPPYNGKDIAAFTIKLLEELKNGNVTAAILICHPKVDTGWFTNAAQAASIICFTRRISFWNPKRPMPTGTFIFSSGTAMQPTMGQAILYFGREEKRFVLAFRKYGNFYRIV